MENKFKQVINFKPGQTPITCHHCSINEYFKNDRYFYKKVSEYHKRKRETFLQAVEIMLLTTSHAQTLRFSIMTTEKLYNATLQFSVYSGEENKIT